MPSKLARHDQSLIWLIPAFDYTSSLTCYCTLDNENDLKEHGDSADGLGSF